MRDRQRERGKTETESERQRKRGGDYKRVTTATQLIKPNYEPTR